MIEVIKTRKTMPADKLVLRFRKEEHLRRRGHIFYVHTKIMLIDLLTADPLIFTGLANFSRTIGGKYAVQVERLCCTISSMLNAWSKTSFRPKFLATNC